MLWRRKLCESGGAPLPGLTFAGKPVRSHGELGHVVNLTDGEALLLYVDAEWKLRFYFHSW